MSVSSILGYEAGCLLRRKPPNRHLGIFSNLADSRSAIPGSDLVFFPLARDFVPICSAFANIKLTLNNSHFVHSTCFNPITVNYACDEILWSSENYTTVKPRKSRARPAEPLSEAEEQKPEAISIDAQSKEFIQLVRETPKL